MESKEAQVMTPSFIEKLARAACDYEGADPDALLGEDFPQWKGHAAYVRAILAAMREPSEEMMEAADAHDLPDSIAPGWVHWQAMIDTALSEKP